MSMVVIFFLCEQIAMWEFQRVEVLPLAISMLLVRQSGSAPQIFFPVLQLNEIWTRTRLKWKCGRRWQMSLLLPVDWCDQWQKGWHGANLTTNREKNSQKICSLTPNVLSWNPNERVLSYPKCRKGKMSVFVVNWHHCSSSLICMRRMEIDV